MFVVDIFLRILSACGVHFKTSERTLSTSKEFKDTFKEIKIVKKSKENVKLKPSINIFALVTFVVSLALVILNLEALTGNYVTEWLYTDTFLHRFVETKASIDVMYTAIIFSVMSFSLSKLASQWKDTRHIRVTRREIKIK